MSTIPKEVKTREDAEKCIRILYREYLENAFSFIVQMATPKFCDECGHEELTWKDAYTFPLKENTKAVYKEARAKAIQTKLNLIELLVQNTIIKEKVIRG